jgi:hypothetical protein
MPTIYNISSINSLYTKFEIKMRRATIEVIPKTADSMN